MPKPAEPKSTLEITELGPGKFGLTVSFDGQRFECGTYVSRAEAQRAGHLFIARKQGERASGKTRRK